MCEKNNVWFKWAYYDYWYSSGLWRRIQHDAKRRQNHLRLRYAAACRYTARLASVYTGRAVTGATLELNCVEIKSKNEGTFVSTTREITQGSTLGPLLFLLYINDLPLNVLDPNIVLFADDTNILISGDNLNIVQSRLNKVMQEIET